MKNPLTPVVRRYIYGVCIAAVPVLIYFKLMPAEAAPVILPLLLAILNIQDNSPPGSQDDTF
jgi:hypothetical protein